MTESQNTSNRFPEEIEISMIEHMNKDHVDAMRDYCHYRNINTGSSDPRMVAIDQDGFDLLVDDQRVRFVFDNKCTTPQEVREALVALAETARAG